MQNNVKIFDIFSGFIFDKLYSNFPKCIEIVVDEDVHKARAKDNSLKVICENFSQSEMNIIFSETMLWLTNNGFIRFKTSQPDRKRPAYPMEYTAFYWVELTINGLNLLKSPPPKTLSQTSVGDEIVASVKNGAYSEAGKIVTSAIFEFALTKLGEK